MFIIKEFLMQSNSTELAGKSTYKVLQTIINVLYRIPAKSKRLKFIPEHNHKMAHNQIILPDHYLYITYFKNYRLIQHLYVDDTMLGQKIVCTIKIIKRTRNDHKSEIMLDIHPEGGKNKPKFLLEINVDGTKNKQHRFFEVFGTNIVLDFPSLDEKKPKKSKKRKQAFN